MFWLERDTRRRRAIPSDGEAAVTMMAVPVAAPQRPMQTIRFVSEPQRLLSPVAAGDVVHEIAHIPPEQQSGIVVDREVDARPPPPSVASARGYGSRRSKTAFTTNCPGFGVPGALGEPSPLGPGG